MARGVHPRRRPPPAGSAERYRGYVRTARERRSRSTRRVVHLIAWPLLMALAALFLAGAGATAGIGSASLLRDIEAAISRAFPVISSPLALDQVGSVQTDPVVDQLPAFTSEASVLLQGHVPLFAMAEGRLVEVALNGTVIARLEPDAAGRFAQQLTLREGENSVVLILLQGETAISSRSATSVLDLTAPTLAIVRPRPGEVVAGGTVVVEGKTEPGARVTVNGRVVVAAADGTFSESFSAGAGLQPIEIIALDQAGNATTAKLSVTVRAPQAVAGTAMTLSLDRTKVRPGETVVADISVLDDGRPQGGVQVTLFVGVVDLGTSRTLANGTVRIGFAAPTTEGEIAVVAIVSNASARATLTVAR